MKLFVSVVFTMPPEKLLDCGVVTLTTVIGWLVVVKAPLSKLLTSKSSAGLPLPVITAVPLYICGCEAAVLCVALLLLPDISYHTLQ